MTWYPDNVLIRAAVYDNKADRHQQRSHNDQLDVDMRRQ
jgi:hypothetical protein